MTRPNDPRGASRRGSDYSDLGYGAAFDASQHIVASRFRPPQDIYGIARYVRQRATTGRCVVCGQLAPLPGATCKSMDCVRAWVFGG